MRTATEQPVVRFPGIVWLLLLALLVLGAGLGLRDPWPADEPRYALIAHDMVESGQWFFPRVAGVLYPDKPPLFFWLIALFYAVTDSLRVAFLLPSLFAGLGTLWLVYDFGRRQWNAQVGLYAAAVLLVTLQFAMQARAAQIDAVLMFWTTLGIYGIARHLLHGPSWGWYCAGFAAAGAGVITKGVGFLPLLILVPWGYARFRRWQTLPMLNGNWRWVAGPAAMLLVISIWLVPMLLLVASNNDAAYANYRDNILFTQTAERYAAAWHHIKPFWYYLLEVMPLFWLPITLALPWLVPAWWRDIKSHDAGVCLLLGWVVLLLLFFSISPGKRGVYILPALPALALACAPHVETLLQRRRFNGLAYFVLALFTAAWSMALLYFLWISPEEGAALVERYEVVPWLLFGLLALAGIGWMLLAPRRGALALSGYFLSLWMVYGIYGYPLLNDTRSPRAMMASVNARLGAGGTLGLVDWKEQLALYARRPFVHFGYRRDQPEKEAEDAMRWIMQGKQRYLMMSGEALNDCLVRERLDHVGFMHRTDWWLASAKSIAPTCTSRLASEPPTYLVKVPQRARREHKP